MKKIVIIGSGGFAQEVAWLIEEINSYKKEWELLGYIDDYYLDRIGNSYGGYKVIGDLNYLNSLHDNVYVVIAIGNGNVRKNIVEKIKNKKFATLIHPNVRMSKSCVINEGSIICSNNVLTVNIEIGKHVIINLNCTIGHSSKIENYVTILPGTNISGDVNIDEYATLGTNSTIIEKKTIGKSSMIGAGTVIIKNVDDDVTVVGNPGKIIKK
jgi:sugar O-acyltransferase (sialic acid O-acetyltransferase NeuD family)